jgi:hypothetical protein
VRLHEGHLVGRQAVAVSGERTAVATPGSLTQTCIIHLVS